MRPMNTSTSPSTKTATFTRPSRARNGEGGLSPLSSRSRVPSRSDRHKDSFIAQRIFLTPRGWHGRGAQDRDHGPPRRRQNVLPSEGHRDARGRRPQGRRHDHRTDRQAKPARRVLRDGLGDEGETRVRLARDHLEDDGRPVRRRYQRARGGWRQRPPGCDRQRGRHRDRRGRQDGSRVAQLRPRGERRPRRGQAAPPHTPQEVPEPAPAGHPPPGRRADPRGHDGEPQPPALQDCETDEGRGPLRTKGYLAPTLFAIAVEFPFPTAAVSEGAANLLVPDVPRRKGPGTAGPWPFYNPTMAMNRDLSAIVLAKWPHPLGSLLDGLAATGAWGIRIALEVGAKHVAFNDRSRDATRLIRENLRRNRLTADVHTGDLSGYLVEPRYDFVDVDPFGPPAPFLGAAFSAAKASSGIGITATDTAVLCGTYPKACEKRYGARPLRSAQGAEIGLRILLGYCHGLAAERGRRVRPILSFSAEHFLRVHVLVEPGSAWDSIGDVVRVGAGRFIAASGADRGAFGPLWLGPLGDPAVLRRLQPSAWSSVVSARLLSLLKAECEMPPFFVTTDELAAGERHSPPKLDRFIGGLREIGYRATRTHFHPRGVKTYAPPQDFVRVFRALSPTGSTGDSGPAS